MPAAWRTAACLTLNLACLVACSRSDPGAQPSAAGSQASPSKTAEPSEAKIAERSSAAEQAKLRPACRALAVSGLARVEGQPITASALLDGAHWLELEAGASVALRHSQTSREFRLIGPGHALPCRDGSEQLLLADGQLSTSALLGVRPGAEVLIATPAGAVHYGDAALDLMVDRKGLRVHVKQGEAWVEPEERGTPRFSNPVHSGAEARLAKASATAESLATACQRAAEAAESSARRVLEGEAAAGSESLGARAAAHMRERSKARVACAIAAAAAYTVSDPAMGQRLSASVAQADALWQSVPRVVAERAGRN